jgi:hypothetical protein
MAEGMVLASNLLYVFKVPEHWRTVTSMISSALSQQRGRYPPWQHGAMKWVVSGSPSRMLFVAGLLQPYEEFRRRRAEGAPRIRKERSCRAHAGRLPLPP